MVDDRPGRRGGALGLAQHDKDARKLDQLERSVGNGRSPKHRRPEPFVRVDILYRQVDMPERDAGVVRACQLRPGLGGTEHGDGEQRYPCDDGAPVSSHVELLPLLR